MLNIIAIEPTVFYTRENNNLLQMVNITIENTSEALQAGLDVKSPDSTLLNDYIVNIKTGKEVYPIYVPDIRETVSVDFILKANGEVQSRISENWRLRKHWQIYMVPISHHDLGYTETIENVLRNYCGFYEDILRFCEETDAWPEESRFRYMVEETWSIQHFIENSSYEVLEKLGRYIREGRIEVPALFGNEISGMCGHEELIRLMYPSFRIKREFGAQIRTASITDIPGLSWGLPTILAGAGVKYFFAGLPTYFRWRVGNISPDIHTFWDEAAILRKHGRPDAFLWQGPDGETVLVYYQGGYGCWTPSSYQDALKSLPIMLNEMEENECPFSVMRYGCSGCGDNTPPDIRVSHIAREWNSKWAYPKLIIGTHSMFFQELERQCQDIRTFSGELPHTDYAVGATSSANETAINRVAHDKLHSAEKFATIASLMSDRPGPAGEIRAAYDNMMLYDEHTWGRAYQVGHEQDFAWSEKAQYAYRSAYLAESILSRSVGRIANLISLEEESQYVVVFNSLSFPRTDLVNIPKFLMEKPFQLMDEETGEKVPYQIVVLDSPQAPVTHSAGWYARGQFDRRELFSLAFVAKDVPPLGYKTYRIVPAESKPDFNSEVVVNDTSMENRFFKVTLNPKTGTVESIYDKELSRELIDKNAEHQANQLVVRWVKTGKKESSERAEIRKGQIGPIYGSLIVSSRASGCPQLTQEIILYNDIKRIGFNNRVLKDSTPAMEVYFAFPFRMDNPNFHFEASNSVIKPLRDQFPGSNSNYYSVQHWANVSDGEAGITFTPIDSHLVEFGGLWPCYVSQAHHGVTPPDFGTDFVREEDLKKGYMYSYVIDSNFRTNFQATQQGDILFRYSITADRCDWRDGRSRDFGWAVCNPLVGVPVNGKRSGALPKSMSFCQVDKPNILILTLKQAEDGDGIITRLIETEGRDVSITLNMPHIRIRQAYLTNLVEENKEAIPALQHAVTVNVKASGIATIRIQL